MRGLALQLAADNELLEVAAGKRARLWIGQVLAHVEVLGDPLVITSRCRAAVDQAVAHDMPSPTAWCVRTTFSESGSVRNCGVADALFRHEGGIAPAPPGDGLAAAGLARQLHRIRRLARPLARDGIEKLRPGRCPRHPPPRRPRRTGPFKIDALQRNAERVIGRHGKAGELEQGLRRVPHPLDRRPERCTIGADHDAWRATRRIPASDRHAPPGVPWRRIVASWQRRLTSSRRCEM